MSVGKESLTCLNNYRRSSQHDCCNSGGCHVTRLVWRHLKPAEVATIIARLVWLTNRRSNGGYGGYATAVTLTVDKLSAHSLARASLVSISLCTLYGFSLSLPALYPRFVAFSLSPLPPKPSLLARSPVLSLSLASPLRPSCSLSLSLVHPLQR